MEADMATTSDFKKTDKTLYSAPEDRPAVLEVPRLPFAWIKGKGDPNSAPFGEAVGALYGFSYAVRMSEKNGDAPKGFEPYTVAPLEGVWTLAQGQAYDPKVKEALGWTIMIRQPGFLDSPAFAKFRDKAREKAVKKGEDPAWFDKLEFGPLDEGLCAQILHRGAYDAEPATFARMEEWLAAEGYARLSKDHREIYLSQPNKEEPRKMKTLLRVRIAKKAG
jgi:hypothetical protein